MRLPSFWCSVLERSEFKREDSWLRTWATLAMFAVVATTLLSGCDPKPSAEEERTNSLFLHEREDPYRVYQYSQSGQVIGEWISDGEPDGVDGELYFYELGTHHRIHVGKPNRYEQDPDAKPGSANQEEHKRKS